MKCSKINTKNKQREKYRLRVRSQDKGNPPSYADVDVDLDVVDQKNKPPIWDSIVYGPKHIKENVPINTVVASIKARFVNTQKIHVATQCYSRYSFLLLTICLLSRNLVACKENFHTSFFIYGEQFTCIQV